MDTRPTPPVASGRAWLRQRATDGWTRLVGFSSKPVVKWLLLAAAALAIAALVLVALERMPLAVSVAVAEKDVAVRVFGLGTVEARVVSKVSFEVGATLMELNADHGDRVKKGDVLARLHDAEQAAKVAKAKANLLSAEAAARKAEAILGKARAVLAQKEAVNRRKKELAARGFVSEQTVEEAQRDDDVARAEATVAARDVEMARAQIQDARAQLQYEQTILDHYTLYAPFDAVVVERSKELGSVVRASDAIFTLTDPASVWALAYVDEARAGRIESGQLAQVRLRSLPDAPHTGRVVRIAIESDRLTEERRVYVKCDRCPANFPLGEQVEVLITVATLPRALLVPEAAVEGYDGVGGAVWTIEDGGLRRRTVTFGHRTEDARLEIVAGLPKGAMVAVNPGAGFAEGRAAYAASPVRP